VNQSGFIVATLIVAFLVYLAINKRLQNYWSLLIGGSASSTSAPSIVPGSATPGTPGVSTGLFTGIPGLDPNAQPFFSIPSGAVPGWLKGLFGGSG